MSAPDLVTQTLWRHITMLDWRSGRYVLRVYDLGTGTYHTVAGSASGGSPLLAPGAAGPLPAQPLTLRGEPADFITLGGDLVIVGGYQPPFVQSSNGDLIQVGG